LCSPPHILPFQVCTTPAESRVAAEPREPKIVSWLSRKSCRASDERAWVRAIHPREICARSTQSPHAKIDPVRLPHQVCAGPCRPSTLKGAQRCIHSRAQGQRKDAAEKTRRWWTQPETRVRAHWSRSALEKCFSSACQLGSARSAAQVSSSIVDRGLNLLLYRFLVKGPISSKNHTMGISCFC
jgi:hypothetical protein